jgi:hypothetical protein
VGEFDRELSLTARLAGGAVVIFGDWRQARASSVPFPIISEEIARIIGFRYKSECALGE